jgi:hypothetical protein
VRGHAFCPLPSANPFDGNYEQEGESKKTRCPEEFRRAASSKPVGGPEHEKADEPASEKYNRGDDADVSEDEQVKKEDEYRASDDDCHRPVSTGRLKGLALFQHIFSPQPLPRGSDLHERRRGKVLLLPPEMDLREGHMRRWVWRTWNVNLHPGTGA